MKKGKEKRRESSEFDAEFNRCEFGEVQLSGNGEGSHISVKESRLNFVTTSENSTMTPENQEVFLRHTQAPFVAESSQRLEEVQNILVTDGKAKVSHSIIHQMKQENHQHNHHHYHESTPSEITEEQFFSFTNSLRERYKNHDDCRYVQLLFGEKKPIEECFVNLTIVKQAKQQEQAKRSLENEKVLGRERYITWHEDIHRDDEKEPIKMAEIFNERLKEDEKEPRKRFPKKILVHGWAGIGKTTLLRKIAYEWATEQLWKDKFDVVLWIRLRKLNSGKISKQHSLPKIVEMELFDKMGKISLNSKSLMHFLHTNPHQDKVLFLLDGYDELNTKKESAKAIHELLQNSAWHMIVTSRPTVTINAEFDSVLETIGFTNENIDEYIKKFFHNHEEKAKQLMAFLKTNPSIYGLAHIPINLELICSVYEEGMSEKAFTNMTHLYQAIEHKLWQRMIDNMPSSILFKDRADDEDRKTDEKDKVSSYLQKLAFEGIKDNHYMLSQQELLKAGEGIYFQRDRNKKRTFDDFKRGYLGKITFSQFLHSPDVEQHKQADFYFLHLTFQEYFAACYLSEQLLSQDEAKVKEAKDFIKNHKYEQRLQYVFWFTVGLLSIEANHEDEEYAKEGQKALNLFFEVFFQEPRDLIGDYEALFLMRCLHEGQLLEKLDDIYQEKIWYSVISLFWQILLSYLDKNTFTHSDFFKNFKRTLAQSTCVLHSQRIESLIMLMFDKHFESSDGSIIDRWRFMMIDVLQYCRLEFLQEAFFPRLLAVLNDPSIIKVKLYIFALLEENFEKMKPNDLQILRQEIIPRLLLPNDENSNKNLGLHRGEEYLNFWAVKILFKSFDTIPTKITERLLNEVLINIILFGSQFVKEYARELFDEHIDKFDSKFIEKLFKKNLPTLLDHEEKHYRIAAAEFMLTYADMTTASIVEKIFNEIIQHTLLSDGDYYQRHISQLFVKYFNKAPTEIAKLILTNLLPDWLRGDNKELCEHAVKSYDTLMDTLPRDIVSTLLNEVLPKVILSRIKSGDFEHHAAKLFFKHKNKISEEIITSVFKQILQILSYDDLGYTKVYAFELLLNYFDMIPAEIKSYVNETLFNHMLRALTDKDDFVRYQAMKLFDKHIDKVPLDIITQLFVEKLPILFVDSYKEIKIKIAGFLLNHHTKAKAELDVNLYVKRSYKMLSTLLLDNNYGVRYEAGNLFGQHFDIFFNRGEIISSLINWLNKNDYKAKEVVETLSDRLQLSQLLRMPMLLQSIVYRKAVCEKARFENISIFYTNENNQFYLHWGRQTVEKIPVDITILEMSNFVKQQSSLLETHANNVSKNYQTTELFKNALLSEVSEHTSQLGCDNAAKANFAKKRYKKICKEVASKNGLSIDNWNSIEVLHLIFSNGQLDQTKEVVQLLLLLGKSFDVTDADEFTVLHKVSANGRLEVVKILVKNGAAIDKTDKYGWTALHRACQYKNLEVVEFLVNNGANISLKTGDDRWTPFHEACFSGCIEIIQCLIDKGADIHEKTKKGLTGLHLACESGHLDAIKFLVVQGAQLDVLDNRGYTLLHIASQCGHLAIVKFLVEQQDANVNLSDKYGWTALHCACINNHLEIVEYLLSKKANVNASRHDGYTSLHNAARNANLEMVTLLVENGGDVNASENSGHTVLHEATEQANLDIVKFLVRNGADVNMAKNDGVTIFHRAIVTGNLDIVRFLVEKGAKVDALTKEGKSALFFISASSVDVVKFLVEEKDATINIKSNTGATPLHLVSRYGELDILKYLIVHGAAINILDNVGRTPLYNAFCEDKLEKIEFLLNSGADIDFTIKGIKSSNEENEFGVLLIECYLKLMVSYNHKAVEDLRDGLNLLRKTSVDIHRDHNQWYLDRIARRCHILALCNPSLYEPLINLANDCFIEAVKIQRRIGILSTYATFLTVRSQCMNENANINSEITLRQEAIKALLAAKDNEDFTSLSFQKHEYLILDYALQYYFYFNEREKHCSLLPIIYVCYLLVVNYLKIDNYSLANKSYSEFRLMIQNDKDCKDIEKFLFQRAGELLDEYQLNQAIMLSLANDENPDKPTKLATSDVWPRSTSHDYFYQLRSKDQLFEESVVVKIMPQLSKWQHFLALRDDWQHKGERHLYHTESCALECSRNNSLFEAIEIFVTTNVEINLRKRVIETIQRDVQLKESINNLIKNQSSLILSTDNGDKKIKSFIHYMQLMQQDGTCGSTIEIIALARNLQRPIAILTPRNVHDVIFEEPAYRNNEPILLNYLDKNQYEPLLIPGGIEPKTILKTIREKIIERIEKESSPGPIISISRHVI